MNDYFWNKFRVYDEHGYFVACFATEREALAAIRNETSERWFLRP